MKKDNFEIIRGKKVDKFHYDCVKNGILKNKKMFGRQPKNIKVFICDTEEEYKKHSKYYYFSHAAGTCLLNGSVIIRSYEFLNRKNRRYYENIVAHEINHSFWYQFYWAQKPVWLHEGIPTILEGRLHYGIKGDYFNFSEVKNKIREMNLNESCLKYRYLERNFNSVEKIVLMYSVWGHFAEFISNKNPKKLVKFMDDYSKNPIKKNYDKLFVKHFGKSIKDKFREFLE